MLVLGYIVSDVKYKNFNETICKLVKSIDECDLELPKLIVGLDAAKKYAKDNNLKFDILNHTYSNGNMWTFKKTEKRDFFEEDVNLFKNYIIRNISKNINYYYINIYKLKYNKIKKLYNILINNLLNRNNNYILIDKNMLYFPLNDKDSIGISFQQFEYIGINKDKIIKKLKSNPQNIILYSTSKNMWKLKEWFKTIEYVIPNIIQNSITN